MGGLGEAAAGLRSGWRSVWLGRDITWRDSGTCEAIDERRRSDIAHSAPREHRQRVPQLLSTWYTQWDGAAFKTEGGARPPSPTICCPGLIIQSTLYCHTLETSICGNSSTLLILDNVNYAGKKRSGTSSASSTTQDLGSYTRRPPNSHNECNSGLVHFRLVLVRRFPRRGVAGRGTR